MEVGETGSFVSMIIIALCGLGFALNRLINEVIVSVKMKKRMKGGTRDTLMALIDKGHGSDTINESVDSNAQDD